MFHVNVSIPNDPTDERFRPRIFTADKIKDVQALQVETKDKTAKDNTITYITLVIQFEHCIATASLNSGKFKIQSQAPTMVRRIQIRGYGEEVLFAEKHGERHKVIKVGFDKHLADIEKTELYTHTKPLVSMQRAAETSYKRLFQQFYIMDTDQNVHGVTD